MIVINLLIKRYKQYFSINIDGKNIIYSIKETGEDVEEFNHEDLKMEIMEEVTNLESTSSNSFSYDSSEILLLQIDYKENYIKKELEKIADYYGISKRYSNSRRGKKKEDLIDEIIYFELNDANKEIVDRRKTMWFYLEELMNDNYLSKFIIFN